MDTHPDEAAQTAYDGDRTDHNEDYLPDFHLKWTAATVCGTSAAVLAILHLTYVIAALRSRVHLRKVYIHTILELCVKMYSE